VPVDLSAVIDLIPNAAPNTTSTIVTKASARIRPDAPPDERRSSAPASATPAPPAVELTPI
jgi:hypothetical protein